MSVFTYDKVATTEVKVYVPEYLLIDDEDLLESYALTCATQRIYIELLKQDEVKMTNILLDLNSGIQIRIEEASDLIRKYWDKSSRIYKVLFSHGHIKS